MFRTGDHTIIPVELTITTSVITFSWVIYGIIKNFDMNQIIPHSIGNKNFSLYKGFIISMITLYYWRIYSEQNKSKESDPNEIRLTDVISKE